MKKLEDYILHHALNQGERIAIISGKERVTYKQLYRLIKERSSILSKESENYVLIRVTQSLDFLITYFAAHLANKVIIPLERIFQKFVFRKLSL